MKYIFPDIVAEVVVEPVGVDLSEHLGKGNAVRRLLAHYLAVQGQEEAVVLLPGEFSHHSELDRGWVLFYGVRRVLYFLE